VTETDDRNDRKIGFQKITLPYVHQKGHKDYSCEVAFILPYIGRTRYYPKRNYSSIQPLQIRFNERPLPYYTI